MHLVYLDFEMEPPQHGKLTSLFASVSITNTPDTNMGIPPNFESLPPELILNIFEFVPEAICEFRRVSAYRFHVFYFKKKYKNNINYFPLRHHKL